MSEGCPNRCGKFIGDKQKFCSRKCFNEYHGNKPDTPVAITLAAIGTVPEETVE